MCKILVFVPLWERMLNLQIEMSDRKKEIYIQMKKGESLSYLLDMFEGEYIEKIGKLPLNKTDRAKMISELFGMSQHLQLQQRRDL